MNRLVLILASVTLIAFTAAGCLFDSGDEKKEPTTFTVTGRVLDSRNFGIDRVTVMLEGATDDGAPVTRIGATDSMGSFAIEHVRNGTYTVSPSKTGFGFYPSSRDVRVQGSNKDVELFTAYSTSGEDGASGVSISGRVVDSFGRGIAGVSVALSGEEVLRAATTDNNGSYSFTRLANGTYRVAPSSNRYTFNPPYLSVFLRDYNYIAEDFTASPAEPDGGGEGPSENAGTHEFYPLSFMSSRTMRVEDADYMTGGTLSYSRTYTAIGVETSGGRDYWRVVYDGGEKSGYYRVSGDTLYAFPRMGPFGSLPADSGDSGKPSGPLDNEVPYLRFDIPSGGEWTILEWESSALGAFFAWNWKGTYLGEEAVDTVTGRIEGCRKYLLVLDTYGVGGGSSSRQTTQTFIWLAPDVGPVKIIETLVTDGVTTSQLTESIVGWSGR